MFPNSVSYRGLQPRMAPVCTGAGARSGSTRFRRRFRRFRRRSVGLWCRDGLGSTGLRRFREGSGRLCCKARSGSTGFRRRFRTRSGRLWCRARRFRRSFQEALVQSQGRRNGFWRRLQRRSWRRFWESLGQVRSNKLNKVSSACLRSTLQKKL